MATNKLQWRRIAKGDKLPCQSFLRKKDGEILKLSTGAGIKVGQDAYYLPVDDVIEEIKNYPIEESKDEMICRKLITFLKQCKAVYCDGFKQFGLDIDDVIAWLEKQGEQKPVEWSEEDEEISEAIIKRIKGESEALSVSLSSAISWVGNIKDRVQLQSQWKPSDEQMNALNYVVNLMASSERPTENDLYYNILKSLRQQLMKLKG